MKFRYAALDECHTITDLDYCTRVDRFDFAMPVRRGDGRLVMHCVKPE